MGSIHWITQYMYEIFDSRIFSLGAPPANKYMSGIPFLTTKLPM